MFRSGPTERTVQERWKNATIPFSNTGTGQRNGPGEMAVLPGTVPGRTAGKRTSVRLFRVVRKRRARLVIPAGSAYE